MRHTLIALLLVLGSGCGDKKAETGPPIPTPGWNDVNAQSEEGTVSLGQCYYPPTWEELGVGDRRIMRQTVLEALMSQWKGEREESVKFDGETILNLETVFLGDMELLEMVAVVNYQNCTESMKSGDTGAWYKWLKDLPGKLTEGECKTPPLYYTLFQPLSVNKGWQVPAYVCAGDRITITASAFDQYRIEAKGPWMNAEGDTSRPATSSAYPCNWEGCYLGQLIMRFTSEDGAVSVIPVGTEKVWEAPGHGRIEVQINDVEWFDNEFKEEGAIIHHTTIEYAPVE